MAWVESIQKAIDFMEDHILDQITIEEIAQHANASAFHFQRTFTILTNITVGEYLRRRRLTLAAKELSATDCKIIDLAFKYGYETPEAFTKAFRRQHGITPSNARKYIGKLKLYERLVIQVILKGAEPMKYNVIEKEPFQIVGIKQEFSCVDWEQSIEISKMWGKANTDGTCELLSKLNNGQVKGMLGICIGEQGEQSIDYWIATESNAEAPEGFLSMVIPASKWVVFEIHGPMPDAMQNGWKQIFSEWFPTSGYEHAGLPELEVYPDHDNPTSPDYYSEIWVPVK